MKNKKHIAMVVATIILATILATMFAGCGNIKYATPYYEFYYSQSRETFLPTDKIVYINKDKTMSIYYGENNRECTYTHDKKTDYIQVDYTDTMTDALIKEYEEYLKESGSAELPIGEVENILRQLKIKDNYHFYKNYLFSEGGVAAYKFVDYTEGYDPGLLQIDGTYMVREADEDTKMLLSEGVIYAQDPSWPQEGKYPIERGTYTVENDFLVMKFTIESETKKDYYARYLLAEIAIPEMIIDTGDDEEGDLTEDELWLSQLRSQLNSLKGKKMKALVSVFNSTSKTLS